MLTGVAIVKRQTETSISEDFEKLELLWSAGEIVKWCCYFGKHFESSQCYTGNHTWPSPLLLSIYLKEIKTVFYMTCGLTVHSSIIHNKQKMKIKYPSTDRWVRVWYTPTTEFCFSIRRNEIVLGGWTVMTLHWKEEARHKEHFTPLTCHI